MSYQILTTFLLILILSVSCEKSKYNDYQKKELVKIINKDNSEVIINECLVASIPIGFPESKSESNLTLYNLFYKENFDFCNPSGISLNGYEAVVITPSVRCGMIQQKANARAMNIKLLLYITQHQVSLPELKSELVTAPAVVLISVAKFNSKQGQWNNCVIGLYNSNDNTKSNWHITQIVTFSLVALTMLMMMVLTVMFTNNVIETNDSLDATNVDQVKYLAVILPIFMIGMLLLLYFFFFVMVWVLIIAFYFLSAYCLAMLLILFMEYYNYLPHLKKPFNKCGISHIDYRFVALYGLGLIISTVWIIYRNTNIGLALNNMMGVYVCIEIAISLGVLFATSRNFKVLLLIMATVLVLDAVMVYVRFGDNKPDASGQLSLFSNQSQLTRVRRSEGNSIMESVATAMNGRSSEEIPIRFKIPHIEWSGQLASNSSCQASSTKYSLIGFGDLILPGVFIVYILIFAVINKAGVLIYFPLTFIGYSVGLGFTYLAVIVSLKGQPALVFLIPFTVLPTLLAAVIRREFMCLWRDSWFPLRAQNGFNEINQGGDNSSDLPTKKVDGEDLPL